MPAFYHDPPALRIQTWSEIWRKLSESGFTGFKIFTGLMCGAGDIELGRYFRTDLKRSKNWLS